MPEVDHADARISRPRGDEPVHVRARTEHGREVPDLLLWSDRLWSVRKISAYTMGRPDGPDRTARHVWRVLVADGPSAAELTCELVQAYPSGHWRLRSVCPAPSSATTVGRD